MQVLEAYIIFPLIRMALIDLSWDVFKGVQSIATLDAFRGALNEGIDFEIGWNIGNPYPNTILKVPYS